MPLLGGMETIIYTIGSGSCVSKGPDREHIL